MIPSIRMGLSLLLATHLISLHAFDGQGTITSQGIERSFLYHAPGDAVAPGLPLVVVFHGMGGNPQQVRNLTGFDAVSDEHGFLVVYPQATVIGGVPQWNAYVDEVAGHGGVGEFDATDDVIFMDDLLEWFCDQYGIDQERIYAAGFSNGAFMAYRLALQRPAVFAAVAPVAGSLWGDEAYLTNAFGSSFTPTSIMHVHGVDDTTIPYPDPQHDPESVIFPLSQFASGACGGSGYQVEPITSTVDRLVFCNGGSPLSRKVQLIRVMGTGHAWPTPEGFNTAGAIWDFFADLSMEEAMFACAITSMEEHRSTLVLQLHPNPVRDLLTVQAYFPPNAKYRVLDGRGAEVHAGWLGNGVLQVGGLSPGVYLLEISGNDGPLRAGRFVRE